MVINGNTLTVTPQDTRPQPEGYSLNGWTAEAKQQYLNEWHAAHPEPPASLPRWRAIRAPPGYDDTADHIANFFKRGGNARARGRGRGLRQQRRHRLPHGQPLVLPPQRGHVGRGGETIKS